MISNIRNNFPTCPCDAVNKIILCCSSFSRSLLTNAHIYNEIDCLHRNVHTKSEPGIQNACRFTWLLLRLPNSRYRRQTCRILRERSLHLRPQHCSTHNHRARASVASGARKGSHLGFKILCNGDKGFSHRSSVHVSLIHFRLSS